MVYRDPETDKVLKIAFHSSKAIVELESLSVGVDEIVEIAGPNEDAAILIKLSGDEPARLAGQLRSNCAVWIFSPAGTFVGPVATLEIQPGQVLATATLDIADLEIDTASWHDFIFWPLEMDAEPEPPSPRPPLRLASDGGSISPNGEVIIFANDLKQRVFVSPIAGDGAEPDDKPANRLQPKCPCIRTIPDRDQSSAE